MTHYVSNQHFNAGRLGCAMRMYLLRQGTHLRTVGCIAAVILILITFCVGLVHIGGAATVSFWYNGVVFVTSMYLSAHSFRQLSDPVSATQLLTQPVSAIEQMLARWLICVPGVALAAAAAVTAAAALASITALCLGWETRSFSILSGVYSPDTLGSLASMCTCQAVFMLGALIWRRNPALNTTLVLIGLCVAYVAVVWIIMAHFLTLQQAATLPDVLTEASIRENLSPTTTIFNTALTLWLYATVYMRLRETDAA